MRKFEFIPDRKKQFLEVLEATGNVSDACRQVAIGRTAVYSHRKKDRSFALEWDEAEAIAMDALEAEAWRRGVDGVDRPIMHGGNQVGVVREYSDRMLEMLLRAHRPEKFNERLVASGRGGNGGDGLMLVETKIILRKRNQVAGDEGL